MACTLHVAWDDRLAGYDFGTGHPMAPVRVELTIELARAFGLFSLAGVSVERPAPATDAQLGMVHIQRYVAAVRQASGPDPNASVLEFGLGTEDDPVFSGMHDASALVAGATLAAARAVWTGTAQHGASIAGGLHHAMRASASGFCVYNDPAIAITWLLAAGAERVAYVDIDVHHAAGVQAAFYDDRGC
jgi:acetoin utilization protein AcuC